MNVAESLATLPQVCANTHTHTHTQWQRSMETVCKVDDAKAGLCTVTVTGRTVKKKQNR